VDETGLDAEEVLVEVDAQAAPPRSTATTTKEPANVLVLEDQRPTDRSIDRAFRAASGLFPRLVTETVNAYYVSVTSTFV